MHVHLADAVSADSDFIFEVRRSAFKAYIDHTEGWDDLASVLEAYPTDAVARITGLAEKDIRQTARWIGEAPEWMMFWTM